MVAWVRTLSEPGSEPRLAREESDEGVSPVIGMILVLGISVTAIAAILYWGLPAIDEMKANVEFKSVQTQFTELDGTIKELVAGTTEKTAKRWEPTLNRGSINVNNNTQGWVYAVDLYQATPTNLVWDGLADGNNVFYVYNAGGAIVAGQMKGYIVTGSSSTTALHVDVLAGGAQMAPATVLNWNANTWKTFYVADSANAGVNIRQATFMFQFYDVAGNKVAESFYMTTGSIDYKLQAGLGEKTVSENNGAVMTGASSPAAIVNTPSIPPPATTNGVPRFFGRSVVLYGDGGYAGDNRFSTLVSLYSTAVLASYDCAQTTHSDCVYRAKLTNFDATTSAAYRTTWYSYLKNTGQGYHWTQNTAPAAMPSGTATAYLSDVPTTGYMGYTLLQSTVLLSG